MSSKQLGEMFKGDSADTCTENVPQRRWGAERRVLRAPTRERGPTLRMQNYYD